MISRFRLAILLFGSILFGSGCGGQSDLQGKVTYNGKPVVSGHVILVDSGGVYHQTEIQLDSSFKLTGVATGQAKIGVTSPNPFGKRYQIPVSDKEPQAKEDPTTARPLPPKGSWFPLPPTAGDPTSSNITIQVGSGKPIEIEVK